MEIDPLLLICEKNNKVNENALLKSYVYSSSFNKHKIINYLNWINLRIIIKTFQEFGIIITIKKIINKLKK